jgi:energy-coupling factor transport system substrate-specific component
MSKNGKGLWSLNFNTATLVLIPTAIGINYLGKLFAGVLKLPLWLDAIGTCLAAVLAGPIAGAICGAANNIIYGLTMDPISTVYALTNIAIGLVVGVMAHKGFMRNIKLALVTALLTGLAAVIVSTPLNVAFWGGTTGNVWGDAVYASAIANNIPVFIASFIDEIIVDLPDKIAVLLIVFVVCKGLPKSLIALYQNGDKIESLDEKY